MKIKEINLFLPIVLLLICCVLMFINTQKQDGELQDLGTLHYKTMALFAENWTRESVDADCPFESEKQFITELFVYAYPKEFDNPQEQSLSALLDKDAINQIFNKKISKSEYFDVLTEVIIWLIKRQKITTDLAQKLEHIHYLTTHGVGSKIILREVNKLKYSQINIKDLKYRTAFVSVYLSSYSFWRSKYAEPFEIQNLNCNRAIVLAGATGALFGITCSKFSAITNAALFSRFAIVNAPCITVDSKKTETNY